MRTHSIRSIVIAWSILLAVTISSAGQAAVPKPYTPVGATSTSFRCLGRETKLGAMLLPQQITAAGKPLLASPIRITADPSTSMGNVTGKGKVTNSDAGSATWEWLGESQGFEISVRMTGDCDGYCWYDVALTPKEPVELSSLRLEIPRRTESARYIHAASFQWGGQLSSGLPEYGGKWNQKFMPYVWLGDEDRGLAWCCESAEGWRLNEPTNALQVRTDGDTVLFTTTFLDHKATISSPIHIRFGLQATPVKPVSFAWRAQARIYHGVTYSSDEPDEDGKILLDLLRDAGVKTVVFHDMWPAYYGQLVPPDPKELHKLIDECHKRGLRLLVYIGYGVARSAPEIQGHHDEWSVIPLIPWVPGYKPEVRTFDATCARSTWGEWLVAGIEKLFTDYKLDGLYFDGTSEAFRCQNELHGCGWRDDAGVLHDTYPMSAVRSMMRRIADIVHKHRPDAILDVHMSASLTMPTLSFCDSYWDGEQYESYTSADKVEIPLDAFRAEFMGYAHGLDAEFLCYQGRPFTFDEAIAIAWLHGVEVRPGNMEGLRAVIPIWGACDRFGIASAEWLPYWKDSGVSASDGSVKASVFAKDRKALIFVSHPKREPASTTLTLDRAKLGLRSGALEAIDAISGKALTVTGDGIPIEFDGMTYHLIEVRSAADH